MIWSAVTPYCHCKEPLTFNKYLIGAFIIGAILQISVALIPPIANMFKLVALDTKQWVYTILISISPIVIIEVQKKINEFKKGKILYKEAKNTAEI